MSDNPIREHELNITRRHFFGRTSLGVGTAALAALLGAGMPGNTANAAIAPMEGVTHHTPKAKRVIYLFMSGGPSHHDLWDYKPKMRDMFGQDLPEHVRDGQRITGMTSKQKTLPVCPSKYEFTHCENNDRGVWVSELLPHTAKVVKELCVIHSTFTDAINHDPAITFIQTGSQVPGRPSLGAWLSYGLGSGNKDLPSYVVMHAKTSFAEQSLFGRLWGSGFLRRRTTRACSCAATRIRVLYLRNPGGVTRADRRAQLDTLAAINQAHYNEFGDPEVLSRIKQHEMAYRMQTAVPELMDTLRGAPDSTFDALRRRGPRGRHLRRLLPQRPPPRRAGRPQHPDLPPRLGRPRHLPKEHESQCEGCRPRPAPRSSLDLKQRGMLDETLVVWGGEFGRTAYCQGKLTKENYGRDHHPRCFTVWMAGGGVKPGITYGQTDDYGYNIVDAGRQPHAPPTAARTSGLPAHHAHPRPQRHHPPPPRHRPQTPHLPLPGPRLPPDGRPRPRGA